MSVLDMNGLLGGIDVLLARTHKPKVGPWCAGAMDVGVLHVGGQKNFNQYRPKLFIEPMIGAAVNAGANNLAYVVTEGSKTTGPDHGCFGDREKVLGYIADFTRSKKRYGVYYKLFDLKKPKEDKIPVKLYLDFDFRVDKGTPWVECWEKVSKAIECVNNAILDNVMQQSDAAKGFSSDYNVCFGERDLAEGQVKFSFHVVWKHQGCCTNKDQGNFMAQCLGGQGTEYDTKVYGTHQLMRTPWCGKERNVNAVLLPMVFAREEGKWNKTVVCEEFCPALFDCFDINVKDMRLTLLHTCKMNSATGGVAVRGAKKAEVVGPENFEDTAIREFFTPLLLDYLLPMIQKHRLKLYEKVKEAGIVTVGGVVVNNLTTSQPERGSRPGQMLVKVIGDTFCEHDKSPSSPHFHKRTRPTLLIDFYEGWYQQLCQRCTDTYQNKYSIFGEDCLSIDGSVFDKYSEQFLSINPKQGATLMLRFYQRELVYNPDKGGIVTYDAGAKIWVVDRRTSLTMMEKKIVFVRKYVAYRRAVNRLNHNALAARGGNAGSKALAKLKALDSKVSKVEPLPSQQKPLMDILMGAWSDTFGGFSNVKFNHRKDLVPMNDGNCYEVRTGRIVPRTKDMYFTSQLAASLKHNAVDAECQEIRRWFMEIARERKPLAMYMRRVTGLLMTGMEFDRKFYANLGKGSNGKSVLYKMLEVQRKTCVCVCVCVCMVLYWSFLLVVAKPIVLFGSYVTVKKRG
jgi:hypothetical protein